MKSQDSLWRRLGARASLVTSMAGMTIVLTSVIFFFVEDDSRRILGVTAGLLFLVLAIYYAAHPFLKEERSYLKLRREVEVFLDLTKQLHYAALREDDTTFESVSARVAPQVELLIDAARESEEQSGSGPTGPGK